MEKKSGSVNSRKEAMLWGGKSEIILVCYGCSSIDGEVRAAFSRRQVTKHFSAQLDIKMYSFVYVLAWRKEHPSTRPVDEL
ncbi:MAG: hypothetical protein V3W07_10015, partial [Syntrophobacteria bacterium]